MMDVTIASGRKLTKVDETSKHGSNDLNSFESFIRIEERGAESRMCWNVWVKEISYTGICTSE